jgi:glycosyltransferase involved in cell wall biosynthesis
LFSRPETRLHLVAPAAWAISVLEQSIVSPAIVTARVIPNGVDQSVFRPGDRGKARASLGIPASARVVAFTVASARSVYKDFETLSAAVGRAAGLWDRPEPLVLLVIGSGRPNLGALPVGVTVHGVPFTPDPSEVARCLQAADVLVHAARAEVLPLSILEAQSTGLPAIVTRTGGAAEALVDGETGFVVNEGDVEAMANRVVQLLADEHARAAMGSAAAAFAAGRFSLQGMADSYLELYAEVREGASPSSW